MVKWDAVKDQFILIQLIGQVKSTADMRQTIIDHWPKSFGPVPTDRAISEHFIKLEKQVKGATGEGVKPEHAATPLTTPPNSARKPAAGMRRSGGGKGKMASSSTSSAAGGKKRRVIDDSDSESAVDTDVETPSKPAKTKRRVGDYAAAPDSATDGGAAVEHPLLVGPPREKLGRTVKQEGGRKRYSGIFDSDSEDSGVEDEYVPEDED